MTWATTLGGLTVTTSDTDVEVVGTTVSGVPDAGGRATFYRVGGPGLALTLRDTRWDSSERDVGAVDRGASPQRFDRLCHGLRLTVADHGPRYVELRQARLKDDHWSNLFNATASELNAGAGVDVAEALRAAGATELGTRADLLHDAGRHRHRLGVLFPPAAAHVPVVAYVLTRVAPILRKVRA